MFGPEKVWTLKSRPGNHRAAEKSAHQGRLLEEAGRREEDEAVHVVRPALPPALHRVDEQRGAAQGVRDHAQAVRLRDARQVVHLIPLPVLPPAPPASARTRPP